MSIPILNTIYLTPLEILSKYPSAIKLGWNERTIITFYEQGALDGGKDSKTGELKILEKSFREVLAFHLKE